LINKLSKLNKRRNFFFQEGKSCWKVLREAVLPLFELGGLLVDLSRECVALSLEFVSLLRECVNLSLEFVSLLREFNSLLLECVGLLRDFCWLLRQFLTLSLEFQ